jgi:hypothetical protein
VEIEVHSTHSVTDTHTHTLTHNHTHNVTLFLILILILIMILILALTDIEIAYIDSLYCTGFIVSRSCCCMCMCVMKLCEDMPDPFDAKRDIWLSHMKDVLNIDENTLAIGHSSGSEALMR